MIRTAVAAATVSLCFAATDARADQPVFDASFVLSGHGELVTTQDDVAPRVAAAGGVMIAAWHASPKEKVVRADNDVFISRSDDGGRTWSDPVQWPDRSNGGHGDSRFPSVATDGDGTWVVVWQSTDSLGGRTRTDEDILFVRSVDGGVTWSQPAPVGMHPTRDWGADIRPKIASDGDDAWVVVWSSRDPLNNSLGGDADILYSRSLDDGATWSDAAAIHDDALTDAGFDLDPSVTSGAAAGHWHVAWSSNSALSGGIKADTDIHLVSSVNNGATWTSPVALNDSAEEDLGDDTQPQIGGRRGGELIAVWTSGGTFGGSTGMDRDVVAARSVDLGKTWTVPKPLSTYEAGDIHHDAAPQLIAWGQKDWFVAWHSWNGLLSEVAGTIPETGSARDLHTGKVDGDTDIFLARSADGGVSWTAPVAVDRAAGRDLGEDLYPHLAATDSGALLVVWQAINREGRLKRIDRDIVASMGAWPAAPDGSR